MSAVIVPRVTCDLPLHPVPLNLAWDHLAHLQLADPGFGVPVDQQAKEMLATNESGEKSDEDLSSSDIPTLEEFVKQEEQKKKEQEKREKKETQI